MKVQGIIEIFKNSQILHTAKYAYYIGDRDSKIFTNLCNAKPYGCHIKAGVYFICSKTDVPISKEGGKDKEELTLLIKPAYRRQKSLVCLRKNSINERKMLSMTVVSFYMVLG